MYVREGSSPFSRMEIRQSVKAGCLILVYLKYQSGQENRENGSDGNGETLLYSVEKLIFLSWSHDFLYLLKAYLKILRQLRTKRTAHCRQLPVCGLEVLRKAVV